MYVISKLKPQWLLLGFGVALVLLFQNCSGFRAQLSNSASFAETSLPDGNWIGYRILSGPSASYPEYVANYNVESDTSDYAIMNEDGRVIYMALYADGYSALVAKDASGNTTTLLEKNNFPNHEMGTVVKVAELNLLLILMSSTFPTIDNYILALPLNGAPSWHLADGATDFQISENGQHIFYFKSQTATAPCSLMASSIKNPSPHLLFSDSSFCFATYFPSRKSHSPMSNIDSIFIQAENGNFQLVGSLPPGMVSPSPQSQTYQAAFSDSSSNGRLLYFNSDVFDGSTGALLGSVYKTSQDMNTCVYVTSERETKVVNAAGRTLVLPDTRSTFLSLRGDLVFSQNQIFSMAGAPAKSVSGDSEFFAFTDNAQFLLGRLTQQFSPAGSGSLMQLTLTSIASGQTLRLTQIGQYRSVFSSGATYLDVGSGIVFEDGWGLYYANYDGTGRVRLDPPRQGETSTPIAEVGAKLIGHLFEYVDWNPISGRVYFLTNSDVQYYSTRKSYGVHNFYQADLAGHALQINQSTRMSAQIKSIMSTNAIADQLNTILFGVADCSHRSLCDTQVFAGNTQGSGKKWAITTPVDYTRAYGTGSASRSFLARGPNSQPVIVTDMDPQQPILDIRDINGRAIQQMANRNSTMFAADHASSPDGNFIFSYDFDQKAYVTSMSTGNSVALNPTLYPLGNGACLGCGGDSWTFSYPGGGFLSNGLLITTANRTPRQPPSSTYLIDPTHLDQPARQLQILNPAILQDGSSIIGGDSAKNIIRIDSNQPETPQILVQGDLQAFTPDGSYIVYSTRKSASTDVFTSGSGHILDMWSSGPDGRPINLTDPSLPAGGYFNGYVTPHLYGYTFLYVYYTTTDCWWVASDIRTGQLLLKSAIPKCDLYGEGIPWITVSKDGGYSFTWNRATQYNGRSQVTAKKLDSSSGSAPLTHADEYIQSLWEQTKGPWMIALVMDVTTQQWNLYAIKKDGSGRTNIGSLQPNRSIRQVAFINGEKSILLLTDAVSRGSFEILRVDLPL